MNRKHALIMLLCCLIPIAAFVAVSVFNVPLSNVLLFGLILLCPLSHILLMKFMMPHHDELPAAHRQAETTIEKECHRAEHLPTPTGYKTETSGR